MIRRVLALITLLVMPLSLLVAESSKHSPWPEIDPKVFERTGSTIDPEAGAEYLYVDKRITAKDYDPPTVQTVIQLQVFTQAAVDELRIMHIPYEGWDFVEAVRCRTHLADGTVLEVENKDINIRDLVKIRDDKVNCISIAPIGLKPGVVLEYMIESEYSYIPLAIIHTYQANYPTALSRFAFRIPSYKGYSLSVIHFNAPDNISLKNDNTHNYIELQNLPKFTEEPYSIGAIHNQATTLFYLRNDDYGNAASYLTNMGERAYKWSQAETKTNRKIRQFCEKIVSKDASEREKLERIYEYCRTSIKNKSRDYDWDKGQLKKLTDDQTPAETLKKGIGYYSDINAAYIALLRCAGLEAVPVLMNDGGFYISPAACSLEPFHISVLRSNWVMNGSIQIRGCAISHWA